ALTGLRRIRQRRILANDLDEGLELETRIGVIRSSLSLVRLIASVGAITTATLLGSSLSGTNWLGITSAALASGIIIILVETPPRMWAAGAPDEFMRRFSLPLATLNSIASPLTKVLPLSSEGAFSQANATSLHSPGLLAAAKQLREFGNNNNEPHELRDDERKMIRAILALNASTVKEIMIPRPDFTALSTEASLDDLVHTLVESGHSRIPLYEENIDHIVGVIYAKDVLNLMLANDEPFKIRKIAREPYFVPETKKVRELLREFQAKTIHFALVVDEHGGVEGLVSLNDVLEEIVGEIEGEFEPPEDDISKISDNIAIVDGSVPLDEVNEALSLDLVADGFETIGGYVLHHLGRIPKAGEHFEAGDLSIEVLMTAGRRIKKLRITKDLSPSEQVPQKVT
ncbi:hemolysin family protein, partial [Dehalococcoidia bacterium]|nr:hemolysin family protein [Dehalococcoidia bacterium]